MVECPDLKALYGERYRVVPEESYFAETGNDINRNTDPWLWIIPCRNGHICPWGPDQLAAVFEGHPIMSRQLAEAGFPVLQDGDDGRTIGFHPDQFGEVAEVIHPYRRPQLSEERRQELRDGMAAVRAQKADGAGGDCFQNAFAAKT